MKELSLDLVVVGLQFVPAVAVLVKDSVSELGPLLDEHLGGAGHGGQGGVPVAEEGLGDGDHLPGLAAALAVLGVREHRGHGRGPGDPDVGILKRGTKCYAL